MRNRSHIIEYGTQEILNPFMVKYLATQHITITIAL